MTKHIFAYLNFGTSTTKYKTCRYQRIILYSFIPWRRTTGPSGPTVAIYNNEPLSERVLPSRRLKSNCCQGTQLCSCSSNNPECTPKHCTPFLPQTTFPLHSSWAVSPAAFVNIWKYLLEEKNKVGVSPYKRCGVTVPHSLRQIQNSLCDFVSPDKVFGVFFFFATG